MTGAGEAGASPARVSAGEGRPHGTAPVPQPHTFDGAPYGAFTEWLADARRATGRRFSYIVTDDLIATENRMPRRNAATVMADQPRAVQDELFAPPPNPVLRHVPTRNIDHGGALADERLVESVRALGIIEPIVLRAVGQRFEVIAGSRRLSAALALGLSTVPAIIHSGDTPLRMRAAMTVSENVMRRYNPQAEARAIRDLMQSGAVSATFLAEKLGLPTPIVLDRMRLAGLIDPWWSVWQRGEMSTTAARAAARLGTVEQRRRWDEYEAEGGSLTAGFFRSDDLTEALDAFAEPFAMPTTDQPPLVRVQAFLRGALQALPQDDQSVEEIGMMLNAVWELVVERNEAHDPEPIAF